MKKWSIPHAQGGSTPTTFYNPNVLNQLAMVCLDNEPKWTVSNILAGICMEYPDREPWHMNAYGVRLFPKWACDTLDKVYDDDDTFLMEYRADRKHRL